MALKRLDRIAGQVFDVAHLAELPADDCNILLVSSRTLHLLAGYAKKDCNFYGRYARDYLQRKWVDVVQAGDTEEDFIDEVARNFRLEVIPMGCDFDSLAAAINNVATALATRPTTGAGSGCADCQQVCINLDDVGPDGSDTATPIPGEFNPASDDYPDGFNSKADYLQYKCELANMIVDGVIKTMRTTAAITSILAIGQVIAATVAAGTAGTVILLTPLGFVGIVAAVIAVLAAGFVSTEILLTMADEVEAARGDIVCRLYEAGNTTAAVDGVVDTLETVIAAAIIAHGVPGPLTGAAGSFLGAVVAHLFNSNTLNQLFQLIADVSYAGADCSGCGQSVACPFVIQFGSGSIYYNGLEVTLTSQEVSGFHLVNIQTLETEGCEFNNWCVEFTEDPGLSLSSANYNRELYWNSSDTYNYGTEQFDFNHNPTTCYFPVGLDLPINGFALTNDVAFTMKFKVKGSVVGSTIAPSVSTACD